MTNKSQQHPRARDPVYVPDLDGAADISVVLLTSIRDSTLGVLTELKWLHAKIDAANALGT